MIVGHSCEAYSQGKSRVLLAKGYGGWLIRTGHVGKLSCLCQGKYGHHLISYRDCLDRLASFDSKTDEV